jgi:hypothetical protein
MSQKNPVTRPGIDPGTFRLVAQRSYLYLLTLKHKYKFTCRNDALKIPHITVCQLSSTVGLLYITLYRTSTHMFISLNFNILSGALKCVSYFGESNCLIKI